MEGKNKTSVDDYVDYLRGKNELQNLIEENIELRKLRESIVIAKFNKNQQYIVSTKGKMELDNSSSFSGIVFDTDSVDDFDTKIEENKIRMIEIIKNS